jgi:hypothetical protein
MIRTWDRRDFDVRVSIFVFTIHHGETTVSFDIQPPIISSKPFPAGNTNTMTKDLLKRWTIRLNVWIIVVVLLCFTFVDAAKTKPKPVKKLHGDSIILTRELVNLCKGQTPVAGKRMEKHLRWLVAASSEASILLNTSPQHAAACWILYVDQQSKHRTTEYMFQQRYALAVMHYASTKLNTTKWDWPMAADEPKVAALSHGNWMRPNVHECQWYGVACHRRNKVIYDLNLGYMKLDGIIPREIALLSGLKELDLHANDLQGVVPIRLVFSLSNLESLKLQMNGFFGAIQREIVGLKKLKELVLFGNYFGGTIPTELSNLKQLQVIDLYANQLEGTIPTTLGLLKQLQMLDLHDNNLVGSVSAEICSLRKHQLKELIVDCLGPKPEVACSCCTICCRGLPDFKCVDVKTGLEIQYSK